MFGNRKARKQAEAQQAAEHQAALVQLRTMAEFMPDENGVVTPDAFQRFFQIVADNDIALTDYPEIRDPVLLGLAAGGYFLQRDTTLILQGDEVAVWEEPAQLLKEVATKQFRRAGLLKSVCPGIAPRSGLALRAEMAEFPAVMGHS